MIFNKNRFEIWDGTQHPLKHSIGDFSFSNPVLPGITNLEDAFNWILAVLYPNSKSSVATVAALPAAGNTINDYRVVLDDGDGKAASYRWEQREGEVTASWHKVYDMDWGQDSILAAFQDNTQDLYVWKNGRTDIDNAGSPVGGVFAGQTIIGGTSANQNLTLKANAGDGTGAQTGFVQVSDQFRPTDNGVIDLGELARQFRKLYLSDEVLVGNTLSIITGSITDSTGSISFGNENLSTTGDLSGAVVTASDSIVVDTGAQQVTIVPGSFTDTTGAISFGNENLSTTGTFSSNTATFLKAGQSLVIDPLSAGKTKITSSTGTIDFDDENLETTGNFLAGNLTANLLNVDNVRLDGNTVSITNANGSLFLAANGSGEIVPGSTINTAYAVTSSADITTTADMLAGNVKLTGNNIESNNVNGNIALNPNGTGKVIFAKSLQPAANNSLDIGESTLRIKDIYVQGSLKNATATFTNADLFALRNTVYRDLARTDPAQNGDALFYDSVNNVWLASTPDTEVNHPQISGLTAGDAGHTQFAMLVGRAGGQNVQGGTAASEHLVLESTAHATKGLVKTKDSLTAFTAPSFSGTWSGTDLGSSSLQFRDLHTKGELKGARLENYTSGTLPAFSGQNVGRIVYATDNAKAYVDTGSQFKVLGVSKFIADQSFDGTQTIKDIDVSADIADARNALWQLKDNANNFEVMYVKILATSATNVRISTSIPLTSGSYRLLGIE